jgi:hypothetical protein
VLPELVHAFQNGNMVRHSGLCFILILTANFIALPSVAEDQQPSASDGSLIFPSVSTPTRSLSGGMAHPKTLLDRASPTSYDQGPLAPTMLEVAPVIGSRDATAVPEEEVCPQCGKPLDHPILGLCGACMRPGQRLLSALRYGRAGQAVISEREPWIYRPFSVGIFFGPIVGSPLVDDWVAQGTGTLAGLRLGWDLDDDWGLEMRFASASIPLVDSDLQKAMQQQYDTDRGLPLDSPFRHRWDSTRTADHFLWDVDMLWYPWGDAKLRPYLLFGIGISRIDFLDRMDVSYSHVLVGMPVGLGVKHRWADWLAFRVECLDNMAYAGHSTFQMQHNFSVTGGLEIRLGRPRTSYWPWDPGMQK